MDRKVIGCLGVTADQYTKVITWTLKGFGRGKSISYYIIHCLKYPHQLTNRAMDHIKDSPPRVEVGHHRGRGSCERHLRAPPTRHRCSESAVVQKKWLHDDKTNPSQQEEEQCWCRSTFWLMLVTMRKLLDTLLPSIASYTQKHRWTCTKALCPHDKWCARRVRVIGIFTALKVLLPDFQPGSTTC
jgi:hypothetical protein